MYNIGDEEVNLIIEGLKRIVLDEWGEEHESNRFVNADIYDKDEYYFFIKIVYGVSTKEKHLINKKYYVVNRTDLKIEEETEE